jgi:hypothetical protein
MKLKNLLTEAESFTATNKKTGKTSVFKTKDSRDSAIKAGTHNKTAGEKDSKKSAKGGVNIFGNPTDKPQTKSKAKSASADMSVDKVEPTPKINSKNWKSDEDGNMSLEASTDVQNYLNNVLGTDGSAEVDYNSGNIQYGLADSENSIFVGYADGKYNVSFEGPSMDFDKIEQSYKSFKNPKEALQYAGELAKTNRKELGLKQDTGEEPKETTPSRKPTEARKGNPQVNVAAKKTAEKYGITPQKLGNEKYKEAMYQAAVSALTDSNFHSEARELVAAIEGKPEFAKKPEYPSIKDPKYKEKMADIRQNSADGSVYMNGTGDIDDYGTDVSQASGWDGVDAADGIAFTLRMNGFHKEADMIQSVFNDKPYMKESRTSLKSIMRK